MAKAGYVQVDLGAKNNAENAISISDLVVQSDTADVVVDYVRNNDGSMFYWGRRGPSVHLRYGVPRNTLLQYAYSELTVPEGQDVIGSYFMANGFGKATLACRSIARRTTRVVFCLEPVFN